MKALDVFYRFFLLGLVSFGGPAAHIGYFRQQFVQKRGWLSDEKYAEIVALSQFLPGPGSSQTGFAVGHHRAGLAGAVAAFIGFTLPSFVLMVMLSIYSSELESDTWQLVVAGLKLLAVVIVADAVLGMFSSFCQQRRTQLICVIAACVLIVSPLAGTQIIILVIAALLGFLLLRQPASAANSGPNAAHTTGTTNKPALLLFIGLFALAFWQGASLFNQFYQNGSLVFGGGHVVLPLLQESIGSEMSNDRFLTGYAGAQAIPGPMFTFASFLGAELQPNSPWLGALIATLAIFLPGLLLMLALQGPWATLAASSGLKGTIAGVNAAVVGLLLATLYQPVFTESVTKPEYFAVVLLGFAALRLFKPPILLLVLSFPVVTVLVG